MSWLRIDDAMDCHPKIIGLGTDEKRWTWVRLLVYTCKYQSEVIPKGIREVIPKATPTFLAECVNLNLIEVREDGAMVVHDWASYQPKRLDPSGAERQKKHREKAAEVNESNVTSSVTSDATEDENNATPHARAVPVPVPSPIEGSNDPSLAAPPSPPKKKRGEKKLEEEAPSAPGRKEVYTILEVVFGYVPDNDDAWTIYRRRVKNIHQSLIATGLPKEQWEAEVRRRCRELYLRFGRDKSKVTVKSLGDHWATVDAEPAFTNGETPAWVATVNRPEIRSLLESAPSVWESKPGWWQSVEPGEFDANEPMSVAELAHRLKERAA